MEILENLMKEFKKRKVDDAILHFSGNNSRQIKFANNKIVKTAVEELKEIGVFAVKDKKIITTNLEDVNNLDSVRIKKFADKVMAYLKKVQPKEDYYGINDKTYSYKTVESGYDPKVKDVDDIDSVEKGINFALKSGAKRTNGIFEVHDTKIEVLTSNDINYDENKSELYFSIRSFVDKDESGHMNVSSTMLKDFKIENAAKLSGEIAKDAKNPIKGKRGNYNLIFSPLAFAPLLDHIGEAASIFSDEIGMSFFNNKLNKKVCDDKVNIYDDGLLKGGIGSTKADDEGVPTQKTVLIENGVFKNYLHSVNTGRKYHVKSTGNAGVLAPEAWNLVVKNGENNLDKIIKEIKNGIYITNVWYTRFADYHNGDFSTIPRDGIFLIKNGRIIKSLKGIRISENILNLLKNIEETGKNQLHLRSWEASTPVLCPEVLVKNCRITTPTD